MKHSGLARNSAPAGKYSRLVANLLPAGCREATLEGRSYTVVPMVMLTEGVHTGSMGPLYYPKDELAKTPAAWNHKPVVVYHPTLNGEGISACEPEVINSRKVGIMLNTRFEGGKLKSEAWIEKERADKVDERVMAAINAAEIMELSTGVFIDVEKTEGKWGTEEYAGIARNFRPDHLALLPDQKGACSIKDGAGFLRNAAGGKEKGLLSWLAKTFGLTSNEMSFSDTSSQLSDAVNAKFNPHDGPRYWIMDVYPDKVIYQAPDGDLYRIGYSISNNVVAITGDPVKVIFTKNYVDATAENATKTEGGESYPSSDYLVVEDPKAPTTWHLRVRNHGTIDHRLMGAAWAALHEGYRGNKYQGPKRAQAMMKLKALYKSEKMALPGSSNTMNKAEKVQAVIASNTGWTDQDKDVLEALNEKQVDMIYNSLPKEGEDDVTDPKDTKDGTQTAAKDTKTGAAEGTTAANAQVTTTNSEPAPEAKKVLTVEEYIAQAPRGIQEVLNAGVASFNTEKAGLVKAILANGQNTFTKEDLETKPLGELKKIARLAGVGTSTARYDGQGLLQQSDQDGEPVLEMPAMNFGK